MSDPKKDPKKRGTIQERLGEMRQEDAADVLKLSRSYTSQILSGERVPTLQTVVHTAKTLGLSKTEIADSAVGFVEDAERVERSKRAKRAANTRKQQQRDT